MKIIGLTGSIGTGKSSVSDILKRKYNIPIIDADKISKEAVMKGSLGLEKIKEAFGSEFILPNGELDRVKMGGLVFENKDARLKLNSIVHPEVKNRFDTLVKEYDDKGYSYVVYDCPLLIEENLMEFVDVVMLVYASFDIQLNRVIKRDKLEKEDALKRIYSQMSLKEKIKYADIIIDNDGDFNRLEEQIKIIYDSKFSKNNTCINMH